MTKRVISQRYVSADPAPYQNVTDPEHWVPLHRYFTVHILLEK
jgi:hypothetical protein